ncbi:uncharacterized protein BJ171DRAFT_495657 [Polychytrium aggregatum]|uniref:uncharacterized protein n=1 Tax=Polychytrium aggregatum TaxID=110093 RepID=UPI0022FEFA9D|nr:uncharacterized protein BJ171DRAFT_495657 [Polychytrium aggregatum]KAI9207099.1 hypothetical protein BJ171DRAFT_495657 [Polychytrium aggregatum]
MPISLPAGHPRAVPATRWLALARRLASAPEIRHRLPTILTTGGPPSPGRRMPRRWTRSRARIRCSSPSRLALLQSPTARTAPGLASLQGTRPHTCVLTKASAETSSWPTSRTSVSSPPRSWLPPLSKACSERKPPISHMPTPPLELTRALTSCSAMSSEYSQHLPATMASSLPGIC